MISEFSLADTDLCVMCAMCTPHCPTYRVYKTETESPRGRLALIHALDKGDIKADKGVAEHLNHCLGCLACERICPSQVPFGKLMDSARQRFTANKQGISHRLLLTLSRHKQGLDYYQRFAGFLNRSKLIKWLPFDSKVRSIVEQAQTTQIDNFYPALNSRKGAVGLFKGCMGKTFDADTLISGIKLLTRLGFDVHIPEDQYCCGALHQHNGDINGALNLADKNQQLFQQYKLDAILYIASGCGSQILKTPFSAPVVNIVSFLLKQLSINPLTFKPLQKHVVVHQGCRGKNELGLGDVSLQLIENIPAIKFHQTPLTDLCCGAGGSTQLDYPELANELLSIKLNELKTMQADFLLSDNSGCSLHFRSGIKRSNLDIEVIHPVTLLAGQLL